MPVRAAAELQPATDLRIAPDRDGWTSLHQAWAVPAMRRDHRHDELEVNLVLDGWAEYLVAGLRVHLPRHGLGWLLPSQPHRLINRSPDLQMWIGVFCPALVASNATPAADGAGPPVAWLYESPEETLVRVPGRAETRELARLFAQLDEPGMSTKRHRIGLAWLLSECWRAFQSADLALTGDHLHPAVELAARWLFDHSGDAEANDLEALASRCGVSRPWLSTLFQQQLGESMTDFRNKQRLQRFRELIAHPMGMPMTAASFAAGFGSYAQCYRTVRRYTGLSPHDLLTEALADGNR
ncbi:AraC family transcriptional regulator [Actinopolymorpha singaporensis]